MALLPRFALSASSNAYLSCFSSLFYRLAWLGLSKRAMKWHLVKNGRVSSRLRFAWVQLARLKRILSLKHSLEFLPTSLSTLELVNVLVEFTDGKAFSSQSWTFHSLQLGVSDCSGSKQLQTASSLPQHDLPWNIPSKSLSYELLYLSETSPMGRELCCRNGMIRASFLPISVGLVTFPR